MLRRDWKVRQRGVESEAAVASRPFRPAHEHEWFHKDSTVWLREFAEQAQLSFSVAKHFASRRIVDSDFAWLGGYPDHRMLSDLGLSAGQAFLLRNFATRMCKKP